MLCLRPSRAELSLGALPLGYDAIVIVKSLDRLIGLWKTLELEIATASGT